MSIPFHYDPSTLESVRTALTLFKSPIVVLYIGPDQIMPLTSVLGAIVGLALMFWNRLVGVTMRCWVAVTRRVKSPRPGSAE